jgi:hypothetical protein
MYIHLYAKLMVCVLFLKRADFDFLGARWEDQSEYFSEISFGGMCFYWYFK